MPKDNKKQKKITTQPAYISFSLKNLGGAWKIFAIEAFLFSLTLVLGIITAFEMSKLLAVQKIPLPTISLWDFFFSFFLITLFILFFASFKKIRRIKRAIYKGFFVFVIFWSGITLLSIWVSDIPAIIIMGFLLFLWFKKPSVLIHNVVIILGLAGAASILGLGFDPKVVIVLLVIFSIYDFIAVYKTKHMIKIAKEMIEEKVILGLIIPMKILDFSKSLNEVKPGGKFLILGGGDVVFPLLLAISLISEGILNSFIVALLALFGLFISYWLFISQKNKQPIPALPPIALFSIIGYLITRLI